MYNSFYLNIEQICVKKEKITFKRANVGCMKICLACNLNATEVFL